eukprot:CAMPEP_0194140230 /NCGR_PEP_ID=MMETSP0152-20130528/9793_1 /TAXON_ID=1049557 /ORGANISM="Thalassiothrix antarctica, Strain L6-D1" /LENGTH=303 /DNA_ID=CAMNT_0038838393 /DNA_START=153 /DNA_END=1064 /DNA_ORIENTATION=+
MNNKNLVIDSHLHVWASSTTESKNFPYAEGQDPPDSLKDVASASSLLKTMESNGVDGALIVQPINHKFDHSYVSKAIEDYPEKFKGMMLHDPSLSSENAISKLEELVLKGYVGVRFNPYLWPKISDGEWKRMSSPNESGIAVYKRCGELKMPVGIMCFQGLQLHYDDIEALLKASPDTTLILDHFGFTSLTDEGNKAFEQLLKLAAYPSVVIKISALFRLQDDDTKSFSRVKEERFQPLLKAFGPERLMFGSDFPFSLEQEGGYSNMVKVVSSWFEDEKSRNEVMGGTAARCFGAWGIKVPQK